MFDSHCHVTDIEQPKEVLAEAHRQGVSSLLCCGYDGASNAAVLALRALVPSLPIALGLHPWFATQGAGDQAHLRGDSMPSIERVLELIERERPCAIGECGLDGYDRDPKIPPIAAQIPVFEAQLALAERLGLPVTVHSRKAVSEVVAVASRFSKVRGVLHAYSGSLEQIRPLLDRGWMVGVGGAITRAGSTRLRKNANRLDLSQVLLETDAPAIGLQGVWPPDVRPHHVIQVARAFAELRGLEFEHVVARSDENARSMFGPAASGKIG